MSIADDIENAALGGPICSGRFVSDWVFGDAHIAVMDLLEGASRSTIADWMAFCDSSRDVKRMFLLMAAESLR